tara:strand:+ start:2685 stop:3800 length:1116 start_codon:yes stop_codon:yes gene_type:complete
MHISLAQPSLGKEELAEIQKVFESGWVAGNGPTGEKLSNEMNKKYGFSYSLPVSNCTTGLHLALLCLEIGEGDDVLVSDFTFPATGHSVKYVGANPIFIDSHKDTYNFDIDDALNKITPNTKAIICVHTFGNMCEMDKIQRFARDNNLYVIEDAACSLGASYQNKYAGDWSDIGCFSMHARKNITSGEGGMMTFKNKDMFLKAKSLSAFGQRRAYERKKSNFSVPVFEELGYNYKLSDISCGILLAQLKGYDQRLKKRRKLAKYYRQKIEKINWLTPQKIVLEENSVLQAFVCLVDEKYSRNSLIEWLKENHIESQIGTYSSSSQPIYDVEHLCPVSRGLFEQSIALPLHSSLTKEDIDSIIFEIERFENV